MSSSRNVEREELSDGKEEPHVIIRDLKKTFDDGSIVACENVDLEISQGEFVVLLGPSGCGKTTTLRCISGLESPDSGEILIGGEDVTTKKPKDRDLAFVFQSIALFPHLSVRKNIGFGLDMKTDLSAREKNERIDEAAKVLGIQDLLDRKPSALSGGQRQRVSLGRAMVMEPQAFLLDEPFSALDANLRDQMRVEVQRLQTKLDIAMIFVTHDQEEAMVLADKLVVMNDGEIEQVGTPHEIYNDPQTRFIAEFIGSPSTNFFDCVVRCDGRTTSLVNDRFELKLTENQVRTLEATDGTEVSVGVRPEDLVISDTGSFDGEITVIEPHGDRDVIHVETEAGRDVTVLVNEARKYAGGDRIGVDVLPESIRVFGRDDRRLL